MPAMCRMGKPNERGVKLNGAIGRAHLRGIAKVASMFAGWSHLVDWTSPHAIVPFLALLHLTGLAGDPREIAEAILISILQVAIIGLLFRPLESVIPAEKWANRKLTRVDWQYTLMMLLGIFPMFSYLVLTPISNAFGGPDDTGSDDSLLGIVHWIPALNQHPLLLFFVYYIIYDLVYYWMHRLQHALPWWWALHSMHHSTRQMSCWTNDRGSPVDGFIQSIILAVVGIVMGVEPDQFAWLMLFGELVQNFSHANVRIGFGKVFGRIFVDPKFHRLHHMLVDPERPTLHNCNYGQVFSIWDVIFGTALYGLAPRPTGVGDPLVDNDNEHGLLGLHWNALKRFWGAVRRPAGWKLGEVAFGESYRPIPIAEWEAHGVGHHPQETPRQEPEEVLPMGNPKSAST